jgi:nicotinamide-nucleotide amidase
LDYNFALARKLQQLMNAKKLTLTTAESCTLGGLAKAIGSCPGASNFFGYGYISYSNAAKMSLLNVPADTLEHHGAVSEECVLAMSRGALAHSQANVAISISGIAGPDGGSDEKPVGTVWLAWVDDQGQQSTQLKHFHSGRKHVQQECVEAALISLIAWAKQR